LLFILERFRNGDARPVYERFDQRGRMMPEGMRYVDSWVTHDLACCYQVVECDDRSSLEQWMSEWSDLVNFEVTAVLTSASAQEAVRSRSITSATAPSPRLPVSDR
jgi:hypothetical protein